MSETIVIVDKGSAASVTQAAVSANTAEQFAIKAVNAAADVVAAVADAVAPGLIAATATATAAANSYANLASDKADIATLAAIAANVDANSANLAADAANLVAQASHDLAFPTVAAMNADLAHAANLTALITNDITRAGKNTYAITTNFVATDTVVFGGITFTAVASGAIGNQFNVGATIAITATNLTSALNANTTINAMFTITSNTNIITITEANAGYGNTPGAMTKTGTGVVSVGTSTVSTSNGIWIKLGESGAGSWQKSAYVPPVVDGSVILAKIGTDVSLAKFPFHPLATMPNNSKVRNAIKKIELYGADPTKHYCLNLLRRNFYVNSSNPNVWSFLIFNTDTNTTVCGFDENVNRDFTGIKDFDLPTKAEGVSGKVWIDWSQLDTPYSSGFMNYNTAGIDISCVKIKVTTKDIVAKAITPSLVSDFIVSNMMPFNPSANLNDNIKIKNAIKKIELYGADPTKHYCLNLLRRNFYVNSSNPNVWSFLIFNTDTNTTVCGFDENVNRDFTGIKDFDLPTKAEGVSGKVWIDWSQLDTPYSSGFMNYSTAGIDISCVKIAEPQVITLDKIDIMMPPAVYMPTSRELWFYDDTILKNSSIYEKMPAKLRITCRKLSDNSLLSGETLAQYNSWGILKGVIDYSATIDIVNLVDNSIPVTKTTNFYKKEVPTGKNISTLIIGDSFIDSKWGDGIQEYINQFATSDGNSLNWIGTRSNYGIANEGRSSWSEYMYATRYVPLAQREPVSGNPVSPNMCSPFVFSADDTALNAHFDFNQYLNSNSIADIKNIVFYLGKNGGDGTYINQMIDNIRISLPNANIFVCSVAPVSHYAPDVQNNINLQNLSYFSKFCGRESEKVFLIPTHINMHREYAFGGSELNMLQFSDIKIVTDTVVTDIHPNALGAKAIAYMIYNYLIYFS